MQLSVLDATLTVTIPVGVPPPEGVTLHCTVNGALKVLGVVDSDKALVMTVVVD